MKIAICLSGSIREPDKSLESLTRFAGHDVSVFIHTWYNVAQIQFDSFRKMPAEEPTSQLLCRYNPQQTVTEGWDWKRYKFIDDLDQWKKDCPHVLPETNNIGMHGMFYSLQKSYRILGDIMKYDVIVRLRFDCLLKQALLPLTVTPGWTIPEGNDFFGLNDQLGWFVPYKGEPERSRREAAAYFEVYDQLDAIIRSGVGHGPEAVLKAAFDRSGIQPMRVPFDYTIY